ncbi:single-stranded-DNA-specific exonuclease RecJ, partial [Paenibacillus albiflavus]
SSTRLRAPAALAAHAGLPAWQLHAGTGAVTPANEHAEQRAFHSVTDVVFYNLPSELDQLRQAVALCTGMQRAYPLFADLDPQNSSVMPSRDEFKGLYSALRSLGQWNIPTAHARVCQELARRLNLSNQTVHFMLAVFEELQFIERDETMMRVAARPSKRDLSESIAYQARLHLAEAEQTCIYTSAKELEQWMRNIQVHTVS